MVFMFDPSFPFPWNVCSEIESVVRVCLKGILWGQSWFLNQPHLRYFSLTLKLESRDPLPPKHLAGKRTLESLPAPEGTICKIFVIMRTQSLYLSLWLLPLNICCIQLCIMDQILTNMYPKTNTSVNSCEISTHFFLLTQICYFEFVFTFLLQFQPSSRFWLTFEMYYLPGA